MAVVSFYSCSFADEERVSNQDTVPPPSEKIIRQNHFPWEKAAMTLPLEVILHHTKKELTVDFGTHVIVENEFEFSFESYFLNAVIVKVGIVSSAQYRNGELYRLDKYIEGTGEVYFQMYRMIKFQNTLVLLSQLSDGSFGRVENEKFEIPLEMQGLLDTELFRGIEKVVEDHDAHISSLDYRDTVPITSSTHLTLKNRSVEYNDLNKFKNRLNPLSVSLTEDTIYIEKTKVPSHSNSSEDPKK
jgi:hypothetical protein